MAEFEQREDGTRIPVFDNGKELVPWTCERCGMFYNPEKIEHDHIPRER